VDGFEALAKITQHKPDIIFVDIMMPGLNGFQATRQLSREPETADSPIIIVSTKGQQTDKIWASSQVPKAILSNWLKKTNYWAVFN
jgi:twitching motility two-component system response regulator PilH